eukprot:175996-Chlamydomonas_euryale.AAC.3
MDTQTNPLMLAAVCDHSVVLCDRLRSQRRARCAKTILRPLSERPPLVRTPGGGVPAGTLQGPCRWG